MKALLYFAPLFGGQTRRFLLTLVLSLTTLVAGVALLGVSGWFLTAAFLTTAGAAFNLFGPSAGVRGLSMLRILSRYGEKLVGHDATLRLLSGLRFWLFGKLFPLMPLSDRTMRHSDLVSRLTADVDALDTAFLVAAGPMVMAWAIGIILTAVLHSFIPEAAYLYAGAFALASIAVPIGLVASTRRTSVRIVAASSALRMAVLDGIDGHMDLRVFGRTDWAARALDARSDELGRARRRLGTLAGIAATAVQFLAGAALVGVVWTGLAAQQAGSVDGPVFVGLVLAVIGSFEATNAIVRSVAKLGTAAAAAERLKAIGTAQPAIVDPDHPTALPPGCSIALENIHFAYDTGRTVLSGLDLTVAAGEHIAIVGPSGCGKSTLASLLLRLADPQAGIMRVAGTDIRGVTQAELHKRVALLSQDSPVFLDTIRNNLLIGDPEASDAALWNALDAVRLGDFVRGLPGGLKHFVGEAGKTLSAGQARRLCLARTLLSPAGIVVLDEPTSGLDRETELAFLADLRLLCMGRTVILITHADLPRGTVDRTLRLADGRFGAREAA